MGYDMSLNARLSPPRIGRPICVLAIVNAARNAVIASRPSMVPKQATGLSLLAFRLGPDDRLPGQREHQPRPGIGHFDPIEQFKVPEMRDFQDGLARRWRKNSAHRLISPAEGGEGCCGRDVTRDAMPMLMLQILPKRRCS